MHVILIFKTVGQHFWPELTAGAELKKEEKQKITPPKTAPPPPPHPKERKTRANHECMLTIPLAA
jgi:hypothetical protein